MNDTTDANPSPPTEPSLWNMVAWPLNSVSIFASLCVMISVVLLRQYRPKKSNRVSFRMTFFVAISDFGFHLCQMLNTRMCSPLTVWGYIFCELCSVFFTCTIALNLQIIWIHGILDSVRLKKLERYYMIVPILLAVVISMPPLVANVVGLDPVKKQCWYLYLNSLSSVIWEWVSLFGPITLSGVHGLLPPLPYPRQLRRVVPWREARDSGAAHYQCYQPRSIQVGFWNASFELHGFALPSRSGHLPGPEHYFHTPRLYQWRSQPGGYAYERRRPVVAGTHQCKHHVSIFISPTILSPSCQKKITEPNPATSPGDHLPPRSSPLQFLAQNLTTLGWAGRLTAGLQVPVHRVSKRRVVVTAALDPTPAPRADPRCRARVAAVPLARDYAAG
ncbi:hypothetical protein BC936DRAFT_144836 [Jimgerdemannia flammicorona]|uniref:G-protein coupled receptors family 2 profile 2 domain-containing protein n=1 Tax=Jimgerdemannia flammicorona TaxID=994334 RepID=A0A433DBK2_9FUNG|nr:hypothetical protein BC936DRAFT_144836 [Jimgerdemannia flammicorona]